MLAQLLRRTLFLQLLVCAGIGYLLVSVTHWPGWIGLVITALLLLLTAVLAAATTALASRAAGEPLAMWWRSLWGEFLADILVFVLRQPWATAPPSLLPATDSAPRKIPVVLVHGYLSNHRIWDDMVDALRASGHPVFAVDLEPLFTSIDNYTPIVETAVTEICRQTGALKVALLGHSMGGLAIRAWMRVHGTHRVARVLTLGTPHAGTELASIAHTANGRQMNWRSPWLQELAAGESAATRGLMRIAITPQDNIVYPQRAQVLNGMEPVIFEGIGHLQLCLDKMVIGWVLEQLASVSNASRG